MNHRLKDQRKTYGMLRMMKAIGRAIKAKTDLEKERAARWAAAWGVISGIRSRGVRLRRTSLSDDQCEDRRRLHRRSL
jgi:hypothetical protein